MHRWTRSLPALLSLGISLAAAGGARADERTQAGPVRVQLLGFNDFHGNLSSGRTLRGRPAGSGAVLVSYLRDEMARFAGETLIVHAGDHVGASPPASGLLQDEPSIQLLNMLGNAFCTPRTRLHPRCNLVGTAGNHEFDEGVTELLRLVRGGNAKAQPGCVAPCRRGPFLERPYRGASFPLVSANVLDARTQRPILPPHVVKTLGGIRIGVIGAVVEATPSMVVASGVRSVRFVDEAEAINRSVRALRKQGIEALVVTLHQGGSMPPYEGPTRPELPGPAGEIAAIVEALDDGVDVVVSGHAHAFTNALMKTRNGHPVLVTQALSAGLAYAKIELTLDAKSGDVVDKRATIVPTYADAGPGLTPARDVAALVARAEQAVAPLTERVLGRASAAFVAEPNAAGESALGNLICDAQRKATGAQIALMNQGGVRTGLDAGDITWGELFSVHPFGNALVVMDLTGAQLLRALEHQYESHPPHGLHASGMRYVWDPSRPVGGRITSVEVGDAPLAPERSYRVVVNSYLAEGGSGFASFREGKNRKGGPLDLDALADFVAKQPGPLTPTLEGRIRTP